MTAEMKTTKKTFLTFQMIGDSRFCTDPLIECISLSARVIESLLNIGALPAHDTPYRLSFNNGENIQYRSNFWVLRSKGNTWNDVMRAINKIKAVPYKKVSR
jgi:hypothetical protein